TRVKNDEIPEIPPPPYSIEYEPSAPSLQESSTLTSSSLSLLSPSSLNIPNLIYAGELAIKGAKDLHLTSYTKYLNTLGKHTDMITLFKSSLKSIVETSETGGKIVRLLDVHGNVIQESVRYV
ncbi:hypothetical protein PV328_012433, partial [Microctonus aethiopoides]